MAMRPARRTAGQVGSKQKAVGSEKTSSVAAVPHGGVAGFAVVGERSALPRAGRARPYPAPKGRLVFA